MAPSFTASTIGIRDSHCSRSFSALKLVFLRCATMSLCRNRVQKQGFNVWDTDAKISKIDGYGINVKYGHERKWLSSNLHLPYSSVGDILASLPVDKEFY